MIIQTPQKRELFASALRTLRLRVFATVLALSIGMVGLTLVRPLEHTPFAAQPVAAATNGTINFQARLQNAAGNIAPDGAYNIEFKLYNVSSGGSALWTEDYYDSNGVTAGNDNRVTVKNGYLTVNLGSQTAFPNTINWDQDLWLTMNVGGTTQTATPTWDGEMNPRLKLTASAYAFRAGQLAQYNGTSGFTSTLSIAGPTGGNQTFVIQDQGAAGTYNLLTSGNGVQLQASTPGSAQTGNFNISGVGIAGSFDSASGGTLNLGTANAATVNIATNASAHTIAIGTSASAAQTITAGSSNSGSTVALQGGSATLTVANAGVTLQMATDSATAFQVVATNSSPIFGVDTTDTNLVANLDPGFESQPLTSWVGKNGGSVARSTAQKYTGNASGQVTTPATANAGIQIPYTFSPSTQYTLSLYARLSSGSMTTLVVGRQDVAGTDINCLTGQSPSSTGWNRYICTFTTGATITNSNIYVQQSDATARAGTLFVDSVQLVTGANAGAYGGGNLQLNATVTTPVAFQNATNSATALSVNNAAGYMLFDVDTQNSRVNVNTTGLGSTFSVAGTQINRTNSTTAFQVQNNSAIPIFLVDTLTNTNNNLVTNYGFEVNTTGWANLTGGTLTRQTTLTNAYGGVASGQIATTATAGAGIRNTTFISTVAAGTYTLSFYAKVASGTFTTLGAGYNTGSDTDCTLNSTTVTTSGFTRYSCTFTTASNLASVYIKQTDATARTIYIDAVQLVSGNVAKPYAAAGALQLRGTINSPLTFQNASDSTTAFQIQNSMGTSNLLVADTLNNAINIGGTLNVSGVINSTVANGTAPLTVASSTLVTNLNADLLDGYNASDFALVGSGSSGYVLLQSGTPGTAQTGNINVSGAILANTVNATTALQTAGTTRIDTSGNLTNIGTVNATGAVTLGSSLNVSGASTLASLTVSGGATFNGAVTISGTATGSFSDPNGVGDNLLRNGNFESGLENWTGGGTGTVVSNVAPPIGSKAFQASGTAPWIISADYIPVDTNKTYQLEGWAHETTDEGKGFYLGLIYYDANKNPVNAANCTSYAYIAASNYQLDSNWRYFAGDVGGGEQSATPYSCPAGNQGSTSGSTGSTSYSKFIPGTRYVRVVAILNYTTPTTSTQEVAGIKFSSVGTTYRASSLNPGTDNLYSIGTSSYRWNNIQLGTGTSNVAGTLNLQASNALNVGGTTVLTSGRVLQNVTTDASILTSGTVNSARISGSYTGITAVGTLTGLKSSGNVYIDTNNFGGTPAIDLAIGDTDTGFDSGGDGQLNAYANNVNVMQFRSSYINSTVSLQTGGTTRLDTSGNLTNINTINSNTFTSTALTFGGAAAATIQSGTNQDLNIIGNGTGSLNLGATTGTNSINIGNSTGSDTVNIATAAGTDTVNIGTNTTSQTSVNVGSTYASTSIKLQGGASSLVVSNSGISLTGNLTATGRQVTLSNFSPEYRYHMGGGVDLNWKKIADINIGTGLYAAAAMQLDITDTNGNHGQNASIKPMRFYVSADRSEGTQDTPDTGSVSGPSTDYVRLVRTALGVYEVQVHQPSNYTNIEIVARVVNQNYATITYADTPADGSTTGTIYTPSTTGYTQELPNADINGNMVMAGTTVINTSRVLQNVTTDASILTSGTVNSARISGSYTGITAVGTLTSLTASGVITSTVATGTAPLTVASTTKVTNLNADLLDGLDSSAFVSSSTLNGYVQLQSSTPGTAQTGNINVTGTIIAGSFSGDGSALTNLNASNLASGTVASARMSGSYTGITAVGTLTSLTVSGAISSSSTITGTTLNGTTGINTGSGAGTQRIDASGNLVNINNIQLQSGTTYDSNRNGAAISVANGLSGRLVNRNAEMLDGTTGYSVYDNSNGGHVTLSSVAVATAPNTTGKVLRVSYDGTGTYASNPTPGYGGFTIATNLCGGTNESVNGYCYREGNRYHVSIWANIPVGYNLVFTTNATGTGSAWTWLTPVAGTGNWMQYEAIQTIGIGGTLSATDYFYTSGAAGSAAFTWDVASLQMIGLDEAPSIESAANINVGYYQGANLSFGQFLTTQSSYLAVSGGGVGIGTISPGSYKLNVQGGDVNFAANLAIGGTNVLTSARVLQNVTTDASILTTGTVASARISGAYTGITAVGTLTSLSVSGDTSLGGNLSVTNDLSALGVVGGKNILPWQQASWEYGTNGQVATNSKNSTVTSVTISTANAFDGTRSLEVATNSSNTDGYVYPNNNSGAYDVPLQPNTKYALSVYAKAASGTPATQLYIHLNNNSYPGTTGTANSTGWTRMVLVFTTPATVTAGAVRVDVDSASSTVDFDGFMLEQIPAAQTTASSWQPSAGLTGVSMDASSNVSFDGNISTGGSLNVAGSTVVTSARVLQNVTANANILTTGTLASSVVSGSYTGITAVGTLTSLTTSGVITSTVATGTAPLTVASTTKVTNLNADLLDGLDSTAFVSSSTLNGYVQLQSGTPGTAQTGNINVSGTIIAGTFSGNGSALTNLNASNLASGTVASARISGSYTGITAVGTLTGLTVQGATNISNGALTIKATSDTTPAFVIQNTDGSSALEIRSGGGGGNQNTFIGVASGSANTSGYYGTALGNSALGLNTTGSSNTAIGNSSLNDNTTGSSNTAVGGSTLYNNVSGSLNTALGSGALYWNTASNNTALGASALYNNTVGTYNVAIGFSSLYANTSGSNNTALGYDAGAQDSNNNFMTSANLQNATAIGAYAQVQASNSIVLGSVDTPTKIGVGTTVPLNTFSVSPLDYQTGTATRTNGSATLTGTGTTWTSAMVGDVIVFADGTTNTVAGFTDATHITMGSNFTGTTDASGVYYRFHKVGLQVTSGGNVGIGTTNPQTALDVAGSISSRQNNLRNYFNVYSAGSTTSSVTGTLEIVLPNTWNNTMLRFQISGYDFSSMAAWQAVISGYNYATTPAWNNTSAEIRGGSAPFSSIRLAYDSAAGKNVLLLGTTSTVWHYPQFVIDEVTAGFTSPAMDTWGSGYSSTFLTSEANITTVNSPATQQIAYTNQAFIQGGNSFGATATLGTNDAQSLVLETGNAARLTITSTGAATFSGTLAVGPANQQITFSAGAGNHGVEIGRIDGTSSTPFIDLHSGATADDYDARIIASGGTGTSGAGTLGLTAANTNLSGNLQMGGTSVITSARVLQNVTTDASILTSGTVASARISGSYTGITAVGTLTSLTTSGVITSTVATGTAPLTVASTTKVTNLNADLLDGLDSTAFATASSLSGYVQLQSGTPGTAQTGNINVSGTIIAGYFSGDGSALANLNASNLASGTVNSARISGSYTGITAVGTLTSLTTSGVITSTVATGTAPLTVASTTAVTNLNADMVDGQHASAFAAASGSANYIQNQNAAAQTASNFWISGTGTAATLNATSGYQINGTVGQASVACTGGAALTNATVQGGIITASSCASGPAVTTIGALDGGTASANGASISGSTLYMQSATTSNAGLVSTGSQTFAGNKTFQGMTTVANNYFKVQDTTLGTLLTADPTTSQLTLTGRTYTQTTSTSASSGCAAGTGWTGTAHGPFTYNGTGTGSLSCGITYVAGAKYTVSYVITTMSSGASVHSQIDGVNSTSHATTGSYSDTFTPSANSSYAYINFSSATATGTIDEIYINYSTTTTVANPTLLIQDASSNPVFSVNANTTLTAMTSTNGSGVLTMTDDNMSAGTMLQLNSANIAGGSYFLRGTRTDTSSDKFYIKGDGSALFSNSLFVQDATTTGSGANPYMKFQDASGTSYGTIGKTTTTNSAFYINADQGNLVLNVTNASNFVDVDTDLQISMTNTATTNGVCHSGSSSNGTAANRFLVVCSGTPNDYAEFYPTETDVTAGDLVATTPNMLTYEASGADPETGIVKSMGTKQISILKKAAAGDSVIGIISTAPYQTIGKDIPTSAHRLPVALNGRVPLHVNNQGGAIHAGDQLTLSTVAGEATKATVAGKTFAVALEDFSGTSGTIMVFVQNGYYDPNTTGNIQGSTMSITGDASIGGNLNVGGLATISSLHVTGNVAIDGTLVATSATFNGTLTVNGHLVTQGNAPQIAVGDALGQASLNVVNSDPVATVDGTDDAGTITVTAGAQQQASGVLAHLSFATAFTTSYKAVISPTNDHATDLRVYIVKTSTGFDLVTKDAPQAGTQYQFDYIVLGAQVATAP